MYYKTSRAYDVTKNMNMSNFLSFLFYQRR